MRSEDRIDLLEVLVEEPSMRAALESVLPRIVGYIPFAIRDFKGKADLLKKLPGVLRGYAAWGRSAQLGVVVLIDRDDDECYELKNQLVAAVPVGMSFGVFSAVDPGAGGRVLNRVACEELEAWFFGDIPAISAAYPRVPHSAGSSAAFRDPDSIRGGTWEALERLLQRHGYHTGGLPKLKAAKAIAPHMNVEENGSVSFAQFRDGVRSLVARGA